MSRKDVKIVMITGYLGAGKTTLLNHVLLNDEGIRAAIIVNDIGEVNIDAELIARGGAELNMDDIIPLTNGCICCTLADDLATQLENIAASGDFDYIVIEASGICEPIPIAYTISQISEIAPQTPLILDNIVAIVDCARMFEEFNGGKDLLLDDIDEDDVESLLIQQIEFCTTLVLNKTDLVTPKQIDELKAIVRSLQKDAKIIEATHGKVPLEDILNTGRFNFVQAFESAAWAHAMEHPEEHEDPETLEYDISTFVYKRRNPFDPELFMNLTDSWPKEIIRCKGILWSSDEPDTCFLFEQAGKHFYLTDNGTFVAADSPEEQAAAFEIAPQLLDDWDPKLGDRMNKLVFIGRHMNRNDIEAKLDACLADY